jgi:hypothetical protein
MRGRLAEAIEVVDGGIESARLTGIAQDLAWRLHIRSSAALAVGDLDTALAAAREAVELSRELEEENFLTAYPGLGLAAALLPSGDPAAAVEILVGAAGGEELPLVPDGWRPMGHELIARWSSAAATTPRAPPRSRWPRPRPSASPWGARGPTALRQP